MLWGATWWDVLTAFGTVGAVVVSVALALRQAWRAKRAEAALAKERQQRLTDERRGIAGLVSGWAEAEYIPSTDGSHFERKVMAYISNESSEPVFDIHALIATGVPPVQLGPLAIPVPIPVLAARHRRHWDITTGLFAHSSGEGRVPGEPVICLEFTDSQGVRWRRDYDGSLQRDPVDRPAPDDEAGIQQIGPVDSAFNPLMAATAFMSALDTAKTVRDLMPVLASTASGWKEMSDDQLKETSRDLAQYGVATHVWYPAPRVAYVRLIHDDDVESVRKGGPGRMQLVTLVFLAGTGWRVFSAGSAATEPDWIKFPKRDLHRELRG